MNFFNSEELNKIIYCKVREFCSSSQNCMYVCVCVKLTGCRHTLANRKFPSPFFPALYIKSHIFNLLLIHCWFYAQKIILSVTLFKKKKSLYVLLLGYINVIIETHDIFAIYNLSTKNNTTILCYIYEIFIYVYVLRERVYSLFLHWTLIILCYVSNCTRSISLIMARTYVDRM